MRLIFLTLYCFYDPFIIELIFFDNFYQSLTFVFSATLCGLPYFDGLSYFSLVKLVFNQTGSTSANLDP